MMGTETKETMQHLHAEAISRKSSTSFAVVQLGVAENITSALSNLTYPETPFQNLVGSLPPTDDNDECSLFADAIAAGLRTCTRTNVLKIEKENDNHLNALGEKEEDECSSQQKAEARKLCKENKFYADGSQELESCILDDDVYGCKCPGRKVDAQTGCKTKHCGGKSNEECEAHQDYIGCYDDYCSSGDKGWIEASAELEGDEAAENQNAKDRDEEMQQNGQNQELTNQLAMEKQAFEMSSATGQRSKVDFFTHLRMQHAAAQAGN